MGGINKKIKLNLKGVKNLYYPTKNKSKRMISKHKLKVLYEDERLPLSKIASEFKVSIWTILYRLQKYGIPRRGKGNPISLKLLTNFYLRKKLMIKEIARRLKCSKAKVSYWVKKYNLAKRIPKYKLERSLLENLYLRKKLSIGQIGTKLKIPHSTIRFYLLKYNLPLRGRGHLLKYPRRNFSGDLKEKAYVLGLRAGDIYARKKGRGVCVQISTTHLSQALMFKSIFGKYGHLCMYITNNSLTGSKDIKAECYVDNSFEFILNKPIKVPEWILEKEDMFYSFLAGFMDCEGFWTISKTYKNNVRLVSGITNINKKILFQLKNKLGRLGFKTNLRLIAKVGTMGPFGKRKKDVYTLDLFRKAEIITLIKKLLPLSRHEEKIQKMKLILKFKDKKWEETKEALLNFHNMVKQQYVDKLENDFILYNLGCRNERGNREIKGTSS